MFILPLCSFFFFFNDTATTEIYTLSLHDALPIWLSIRQAAGTTPNWCTRLPSSSTAAMDPPRSEEHTSELQSQSNLVCRLLLEKKKTTIRLPSPLHKLRQAASDSHLPAILLRSAT